jgi:hypothetical protein
MGDPTLLQGIIRGTSPCDGCTERFEACWGRCPKDARGERGYKAWSAEIEETKAKKKAYYDLNRRRRQWRRKIF